MYDINAEWSVTKVLVLRWCALANEINQYGCRSLIWLQIFDADLIDFGKLSISRFADSFWSLLVFQSNPPNQPLPTLAR